MYSNSNNYFNNNSILNIVIQNRDKTRTKRISRAINRMGNPNVKRAVNNANRSYSTTNMKGTHLTASSLFNNSSMATSLGPPHQIPPYNHTSTNKLQPSGPKLLDNQSYVYKKTFGESNAFNSQASMTSYTTQSLYNNDLPNDKKDSKSDHSQGFLHTAKPLANQLIPLINIPIQSGNGGFVRLDKPQYNFQRRKSNTFS